MLSRSDLCKHSKQYSCSENVIKSFWRTFFNMLSLKVLANNIFYIGKPKKLL